MKQQWQFLRRYNGCVIEHRPGMQRRGYRVIYRTQTGIGATVHYTEEKCLTYIDRLHKRLGSQVEVTRSDYESWTRG